MPVSNPRQRARRREQVIVLEARAEAGIRGHAASAYPDECCGALVGTSGLAGRVVTDAWPLANAAGEPSHRFVVSASDYRQAEMRTRQEGVTLLGFYHSHPDAPAEPSPYDLRQAWPNFDYIIVSVVRAEPGHITCWRLREDRSAFESEDITWPTAS
jgi:proteasome lid subunit RPN8/RPN11